MRDAISLLDQLLSYGDEVVELARVESVLGLVDAHAIGRLVDHMATGDAAAGLSLINRLVADGVELGELVDQIVTYLRGVLFVGITRTPELLDVPQDIAEMMARQARVLTVAFLLNALREFIGIRVLLRDQVPGVPQLPVEMAFLRSVRPVMERASPSESATAATTAHAAPAERPAATSAQAAVGRPLQPDPGSPAPSRAPAAKLPEDLREGVSPAEHGTEVGDLVRANWERFLTLAGKQGGMKVQAALRSVREVNTAGQTIILQFAHAFSRDLVNQVANRSQVEALWEEILAQKVEVRCTVVGEVPVARNTGPTVPASAGRRRDDEESLLSDAQKLGAVIKPII
jgi:DNA polymerase-3 subunit gamma/tau